VIAKPVICLFAEDRPYDMWPFASFPQETVDSNLQQREIALRTTAPYDEALHGSYLRASGEFVRAPKLKDALIRA
jgi:hypothetical protein